MAQRIRAASAAYELDIFPLLHFLLTKGTVWRERTAQISLWLGVGGPEARRRDLEQCLLWWHIEQVVEWQGSTKRPCSGQ